jgi:hypothetical protein
MTRSFRQSRVSSLDYVTRVETTLKMRLIRKMRSDLALTIEPDMVLAYPNQASTKPSPSSWSSDSSSASCLCTA